MSSVEPEPPFAGRPTAAGSRRCGRLCLRLPIGNAHLPLAASSATDLAAILLADDAAVRTRRLRLLLQADAAVAVWAQLESRSSGPELSPDPVAAVELLARRLPWLLPSALVAPSDSPLRERQLTLALARAEATMVVVRRVARRGVGLHTPVAWHTLAALAIDAIAETLPPEDAASLRRAVEPADRRPTVTIGNDVARGDPADERRYRRALGRALRSRQRAYSGLAAQLAAIVHRAARLARLEEDFARELESAKLAALKEFAYGAGHEINNPLATIAGRAQTLLLDESDPERRRALAAIVSQAFRAHEMIADLMLFAHPPAVKPETFDLTALLDDVAASAAEAAGAQGTQLSVVAEVRPLAIAADRSQVATAVRALTVNALQALRNGGRVELRCRPQADDRTGRTGTAILVADDGPGIDPAVRPHIFDPFFSGREAGRGLGFGLSKCWRIAHQHGGQIDVVEHGGPGATFRLWLPQGTPE